MVSILGMMQTASATSPGTFTTTAGVNMRAEPSTSANVLRAVGIGTNVDVLDHNPAGWSRVQVGNTTGFIRSDFLRVPVGNTAATFRTTEGVNLRASASTTSNVLRTVARGTNVEVTDHNPAGWSRVNVGGTSGFIRSDFLARGNSTAATASAASTDNVVATLRTTGVVNMRSGSSTGHSIIRTLASNTSVEVLENQANGWSRVRHNSTAGFIRSDLLSESGAAQQSTTLRTTGTVNMRSGASTGHNIVRTLTANTSVTVFENQSNGWSRVSHNGTNGFIRSDLLSATGAAGASTAVGTRFTVTGVNMRSGASTGHSIIRLLPVNTSVEVLENQSNGWSRVTHNGTAGFIRSDLLSANRTSSGSGNVELLSWSSVRNTVIRTGVTLHVTDVRTGITFRMVSFSNGNHADVVPLYREDTEAFRQAFGGRWSWTPRPVLVYVDGRTIAASMNGMPHGGSHRSQHNGLTGHFCMHFYGSRTHNGNRNHENDHQRAVQEAFNSRR